MNKQLIAEIYKELTGREAKQTECRQCWNDYVIEINTIMGKKKKAGENTAELQEKIVEAVTGSSPEPTKKATKPKVSGERKYELHPCYSISVGGRIYTSRNLTDKAAEEYLASGGGRQWFKRLPK